MLGIFVLLLIAMLLVVKFCKKTVKIVLSIIIILAVLYCMVISVDISRVNSFREPIFAISSELRDYENYSYKEIAEITSLSETQVKVYIFRARNFMKDFIRKPELIL